MDTFTSACDPFGLTISTKKTGVMFQPAPHTNYTDPIITVKGQNLQTVDIFTYLGSTLSRISKVSTAFGRLRNNVWERQGLNLQTKLKIVKAIVMTNLLYACETWTVCFRNARKLNRFHVSSLRRLLLITWQDMILDMEVLQCAGLQGIHALGLAMLSE